MPSSDTQFKPGNPGGPGRPQGMRNKLSEKFIQVLCEDFTEHGVELIEELRQTQPAQYANVIAKLMPKLMELSGPDGSEIPTKAIVEYVGVGTSSSE